MRVGDSTRLPTHRRPISCRSALLRNGHFNSLHHNDSPIPKKTFQAMKKTSSRCFKTFFFFGSSFVPSFVALFIVRCIEILRCKKSHSRFFMISAFVLFAWRFLFLPFFSVKYCLMFMRKLCEAISLRHRRKHPRPIGVNKNSLKGRVKSFCGPT